MIAHKSNSYFVSVGSKLTASFDDQIRFDNYWSALGKRLENTLYFTQVSVNYVKTILNPMENSAPSCDEIPIVFYKEFYGNLRAIITEICNDWLILDIFPEKISIAKVK